MLAKKHAQLSSCGGRRGWAVATALNLLLAAAVACWLPHTGFEGKTCLVTISGARI